MPVFEAFSVTNTECFSRVVLEAGIYSSHIIWRIRYRKLRKEAKETGKSIDDLLELRRRESQSNEESRDLEAGALGQDEVSAKVQSSIEPEPGTGTGIGTGHHMGPMERSESEKC